MRFLPIFANLLEKYSYLAHQHSCIRSRLSLSCNWLRLSCEDICHTLSIIYKKNCVGTQICGLLSHSLRVLIIPASIMYFYSAPTRCQRDRRLARDLLLMMRAVIVRLVVGVSLEVVGLYVQLSF